MHHHKQSPKREAHLEDLVAPAALGNVNVGAAELPQIASPCVQHAPAQAPTQQPVMKALFPELQATAISMQLRQCTTWVACATWVACTTWVACAIACTTF